MSNMRGALVVFITAALIPTALFQLIPPRYRPGTVVDEMEFSDLDKALDDVMRAGDLMHDRRCAMSISNEGGPRLINPRHHFAAGLSHSAPYPIIENGESALHLFLKTPWALRGTQGVITYDLEGTDFKLAVMWYTPFDRNLYDNQFNFKIYGQSYGTGNDMWRMMKNRAGPFLARGWEERTEYGVKMRAVMADSTQSKYMIWIDASGFDRTLPRETHVRCAYHPGRFVNHCWKECTYHGWCWIINRCDSHQQCRDRNLGQVACDGRCQNP